jgi:hypothetical protein
LEPAAFQIARWARRWLVDMQPYASSLGGSAAAASANAPPVVDGDFVAVHQAATMLVDQLRRDEASNELSEQIAAGDGLAGAPGTTAGAHNYFHGPYSALGLSPVEHCGFAPMPRALLEAMQAAHASAAPPTSFVGLLPEIEHAWLSLGPKLYLWNYTRTDDFVVFEGLEQSIVTVGLAWPRASVFREHVRHLLVVTTPVEIVLLAHSAEAAGDTTGGGGGGGGGGGARGVWDRPDSLLGDSATTALPPSTAAAERHSPCAAAAAFRACAGVAVDASASRYC